MLEVVGDPGSSPSVLRESVHTSPKADDQAVPELLAPSAPLQHLLSVQENDRKDDAVPNEGRTHDEMSRTLSRVISATVALASNSTKDHLHPSRDRHNASKNSMRLHLVWPDLSQEALLQVQPQVDAQHDLHNKHEHQPVRKCSVDIVRKLPALMEVAQEVSHYCNRCSENLRRNVPS